MAKLCQTGVAWPHSCPWNLLRFLWSEESEAEVRESRELEQTPMTSDDIRWIWENGRSSNHPNHLRSSATYHILSPLYSILFDLKFRFGVEHGPRYHVLVRSPHTSLSLRVYVRTAHSWWGLENGWKKYSPRLQSPETSACTFRMIAMKLRRCRERCSTFNTSVTSSLGLYMCHLPSSAHILSQMIPNAAFVTSTASTFYAQFLLSASSCSFPEAGTGGRHPRSLTWRLTVAACWIDHDALESLNFDRFNTTHQTRAWGPFAKMAVACGSGCHRMTECLHVFLNRWFDVSWVLLVRHFDTRGDHFFGLPRRPGSIAIRGPDELCVTSEAKVQAAHWRSKPERG